MQSLQKSLIDSLNFFPASTQFPCAWAGHLPFAAWTMRMLAPQNFVELGTHSGNSYFTFCQAVLEGKLATRCHAVDTWQGDEHAGSYTNDIFEYVSSHNEQHYAEFSKLLRMTFNQAVDFFDDNSIDLLHIDGLHTYEAVRHDYETWLPKLAPGAVVLFHDTHEHERDFGVWKFWKELCATHPYHLEFIHSHGLGVLQHGQDKEKASWLVPDSEQQKLVLNFFSSLGELHLDRCELSCRTEELHRTATNLHDTTIRLEEREELITHQELVIKQHEIHIKGIYASRSWRCTKPLRNICNWARSFRETLHNLILTQKDNLFYHLRSWYQKFQFHLYHLVPDTIRMVPIRIYKVGKIIILLPHILRKGGGTIGSLRKAKKIFSTEGVRGVMNRLRTFIAKPSPTLLTPEVCAECETKLNIVPYYISDTEETNRDLPASAPTIALHIHLFYTDMLSEFTSRLSAMPLAFDLFVSVPDSADIVDLTQRFRQELPQANQIIIENVPNRGRDIAPLIVQFGKRMAQYDLIAHFHSKKSPHCNGLAKWCADLLDTLLGQPKNNGGRLIAIVNLLLNRAKLVYPEGQTQILKDRTGWSENKDLARSLLNKYTNLSVDDFPAVSFPEGSMFWARSASLSAMLNLPLRYADFPAEPIPADGTLAHAIERLLLIFASTAHGQCLRLHHGDSQHDYRYYEEQKDFSSSVGNSDIKILSYYLPQFHPIPENDKWHGQGFTEWTKVRSANPLFFSHYQQHIPHPDLGYYLLDSPDTLRQQAELMKKSGVYGQVFYHYWFSGKLILEKPAQMLLEHPDINMPFCFCWANENWTRRWDGNEQDVLLAQNYSPEDARAFIRYLIPFFNDKRYLRVEDRPVLFIYRPASITEPAEYIRAWAEECHAAGLKPPFLVAVLTRGATDPRDFGMDAGVERPLHDWTNGNVTDIRATLHAYEPLKGSVLAYPQVAQYYMEENEPKEFTWFRSILPMWDNTARYGAEAYMLHGSSPELFQTWLEQAIAFSRAQLAPDRRFILINAWNEWAEGAHIEPDSRHGYAYLNSIGRALSGLSPSEDINPNKKLPAGLHVRLSFPETILISLRADVSLRQRFARCLSASTLFAQCKVSLDTEEFNNELKDHEIQPTEVAEPDFILQFRRPALFAPTTLENMLKTAVNTPGAVILSNSYDRFSPIIEGTANGSVEPWVAFNAPVLVFPIKTVRHGYKNYRVRGDAMTFTTTPSQGKHKDLPEITTIVRFHRKGDLNRLSNALYCLAAMENCIVSPLIAAQDLTSDQTNVVEKMIDNLPLASGGIAKIVSYSSTKEHPDLRARMLTKSLQQVRTRYAAFLDYDDLIMSHAYCWMIERMQKTNKAVAFGRVFSTTFDSQTGLFKDRRCEFTYGQSYQDFLRVNHAPLHSFMLDLSKVETRNLVFNDDQKFLEDYFLTLQLFTEDNADWDSLAKNTYIGDYLHSTDHGNTLALLDKTSRKDVFKKPDYHTCENRIRTLKERLLQIDCKH